MYQSATENTKTCKLHCYPVYQSVTLLSCVSVSNPDTWSVYWNISQQQSLWRPVSYAVPLCQSVKVGYSGLSPGLYTGISVSDKVYKDQCQPHCYPVYQSVTQCYPLYQSVTQGIATCHLKCTPEYQSVTKYMKTCQLHCTPMYQSVTWGRHLECIDLPEYQSANLSATLLLIILVCNLGYSGLSPGVYTGISVSDKVYEDL